MMKMVVEGLESVGKRTLIQRGWRSLGLDAKSLPPHIKLIGHAPHDWLFSQASLIIHHGGAGTTAACLRAGVPAIVIPWMIDQPDWGELTTTVGRHLCSNSAAGIDGRKTGFCDPSDI